MASSKSMKMSLLVLCLKSSRSKTEEIEPGVFVLGGLQKISNNQEQSIGKSELRALRREVPTWGKMWSFKRCQVNGVVYHSKVYKRVTARNNFTVSFTTDKQTGYGSILRYVKVEEKCHQAQCIDMRCNCHLECSFFALLKILIVHQDQLPKLREKAVVGHIIRVEETSKIVAVPLQCIKEKFLLVSISSGIFLCHLANRIERD